MPQRETPKRDHADESAGEQRSRQSAREVTEWETAFAAARKQGASAEPIDADRANPGAVVSRAHRAEKSSGQSPGAAQPGHTSTQKAP
jgi:hypothetical protein